MDKFKESLTNILKSMVPSSESRKETVDRFKSAFRTDPAKLLAEISNTSKKSFVVLQAIQENIDRMREMMDDKKEDQKGGFLSKLIKGILTTLGITALFKGITSMLKKFPGIAGNAVKNAFKGIGKIITAGVVAGLSGIVAILKGLVEGVGKLLGIKIPTKPTINPSTKTQQPPRTTTTTTQKQQPSRTTTTTTNQPQRTSSNTVKPTTKPGAIVIPETSKARTEVQQSSMKEAAKGPIKPDAKDTAKLSAKSLGKSALKKVPGLGLLAGIAFGVDRAMGGDLKGAGLEVTSGFASLFPGFGTAASIATDAALLKHDLDRASGDGGDSYKVDVAKDTMNQINPNITNQGVGVASPVMVNQRTTSKTLQDQQTRTDVINTTTQQSAPLNVVNSSTNNVVNNTQNMVNKTKPRDNENALEREVFKHSSFGLV